MSSLQERENTFTGEYFVRNYGIILKRHLWDTKNTQMRQNSGAIYLETNTRQKDSSNMLTIETCIKRYVGKWIARLQFRACLVWRELSMEFSFWLMEGFLCMEREWDPEFDRPGLKPSLHALATIWPWAYYFISWCLCFSICKMKATRLILEGRPRIMPRITFYKCPCPSSPFPTLSKGSI